VPYCDGMTLLHPIDSALCVGLFLAALLVPSVLVAGDAVAFADLDGEEMALLMRANQHRAARMEGDNAVAALIRSRIVSGNINLWSKMGAKINVPPLVLNPALTIAARSLLGGGVKPTDGKPCDAGPALRAAGYPTPEGTMTMIGLGGSDQATAYAMALLNVVGTRENKGGGAFDVYAAQDGMREKWREIGVAANGVDAVIILGVGTAARYVGGVVYADADHDLCYGRGEGRAGVTVSCGSARMTTGPSGAWWLAVAADAVEVTFDGVGSTASRPIASGAGNQLLDWRVPDQADQRMVDRLIADAEKVAKSADADKRRTPLAALLVASRTAALDDARRQRIDDLVAPVADEFETVAVRVMRALGEDPAEFRKQLADIQKTWKGAMPGWFKEAAALGKLREQVVKVQSAPETDQGGLAGPVLKQVQKAKKGSVDPMFLGQYRIWEEQLAMLVPPVPARHGALRR
jgi:hypothetical protein